MSAVVTTVPVVLGNVSVVSLVGSATVTVISCALSVAPSNLTVTSSPNAISPVIVPPVVSNALLLFSCVLYKFCVNYRLNLLIL